ncbi:MAG: DUF2911 domain-containing protein [Gemmatimonadaceae bacterium]
MRHTTRLRAAAAAPIALALLAACSAAVPAPATPIPDASTTLVVRLGADTIAMEQYTRTPSRMEGVLVQRSPFTTIARYSVELGATGAPARAEYSLRRGDGTQITGNMQSLSVRYGADSVTMVGHRGSGDTTRVAPARGLLLPYVNGSYGLYELAIARLRNSGRDSADFQIVPLNFNVRGTSVLPLKVTGPNAVRITWFGYPLIIEHDGHANITLVDGSRTTVKVRGERTANVNLDTIARQWTAHDQTAGALGNVSTRDTARATIGNAHVWVDYGRPSLRGRDVWVNGVLGDTIWRTGANAATQLRTDTDISIGGTAVPAGIYSLWTSATPGGYQLIVNRQAGQWGTEYHPDRDLARIPLRESAAAAPVERFTVAIEPQSAQAGLLTLTWGTKQLSVPVTAK